MRCLVYQSIRAKYKHVKSIFVGIQLGNSPTDSTSSFLEVMIIEAKTLKLPVVALSFCLPVRKVFPRVFEHVLPCRNTTPPSLREVFLSVVISSVAPAQLRDSNIFSVLLGDNFVRLANTLNASQVYVVKK